MKIASIGGRAHIVTPKGGIDIAAASGGKFSSHVKTLMSQTTELGSWLGGATPDYDPALSTSTLQANLSRLDAPIGDPDQIFAIGVNYPGHVKESGLQTPSDPMVFTKFQSSLAGPGAQVPLPSQTVDWEVELVVVVGKAGRSISKDDAMKHVAGYCVGQDLSDRSTQFVSDPAQFSMGKSYEAFSPIGPWITTADEVDAAALRLTCSNDGQSLQDGNTKDMIFDVPALIAYLSSICELHVGDLIFTGTPDGVGIGRKPYMFISDGWKLTSTIEDLGTLENQCGAR